jgi:hypothetical protein
MAGTVAMLRAFSDLESTEGLKIGDCLFLYRCERGSRMLLIVSSNRELEGNGCSALDLKHG